MAKMKQLSLVFEAPTIERNDHATYRRFLLLDYLEQLESRTAMVNYDDGFMQFSLPVQIGEMMFSSLTKSFPELFKLKASDSSIHIGKAPSSLTVEGSLIKATYSKTLFGSDTKKKGNQKTTIQEGISGKAHIELKHFDVPTWRKEKVLKEEFKGVHLCGKTIQISVSNPEDWISKVISLPFVVNDFQLSGSVLRIRGSLGAEIFYHGVVGVRHNEEYTIIDIRDPLGRMDRSLHIWHTRPQFL